MENSAERSSGHKKPISSPQGPPTIMPHSSTGMCIGKSMEPISGICPVKNGSTRPRARNMALSTSFFTGEKRSCFLFIRKNPFRRFGPKRRTNAMM